MSISVPPLPLIYGFVRILVLWAQLLGSLCSQFLQLLTVSKGTCTPNQPAPSFALPRADWFKDNAKISNESSLCSADMRVLMCGGWPHSSSRQSIMQHSCSFAAFHSTLSLAATSRASKSAPKGSGNAAFHSNEWMIKPWHGEGKGGVGGEGRKILRRNRESGWGVISRCCNLFSF